MDFINQTVHVQQMCGGGYVEGWYSKLFFASDGTKEDPTIADVHTQYTDEAGNVVGRVLHVGAADPRLMITTINTCSGPKAYAGLGVLVPRAGDRKLPTADRPGLDDDACRRAAGCRLALPGARALND